LSDFAVTKLQITINPNISTFPMDKNVTMGKLRRLHLVTHHPQAKYQMLENVG